MKLKERYFQIGLFFSYFHLDVRCFFIIFAAKTMNMKYDVIIPVAYRDYAFLKKSCSYLCDNLDADTIYILTEGRMARFLPSKIRKNPKIVVLDEDLIIDNLTFEKVGSYLRSLGRNTYPGWYFQQFLKMGFALSKYCKNDYYLSWDADTVPVKKIDFFDGCGKPFFSMKTEYYEPYFDTMEKLLGFGKVNKKSYIAEHMMFSRDIMKSLIEKIEDCSLEGELWYEKILSALPPIECGDHTFSEFETYGTYCKNYFKDAYQERVLTGFRLGGLIQGRFPSSRIIRTFADYDFHIVSFEIYHYPPFPWGLFCKWYEKKYIKFKGRVLKKIAYNLH